MNQKSSRKISKGLVKSLLTLINEGGVSCANLKEEDLCSRLLASGCIRRERVSRGRSRFVLLDEAALRACCRDYDLRLKDLEGQFKLLDEGAIVASPSEYISKYGKDHLGKRNLWNGFFIKSNKPMPVFYNGQAWNLSESCPLLVEDTSLLKLETEEVNLWVVENYECFKDLSWMNHFPNGSQKSVVICRWPCSPKAAKEAIKSLGIQNMYYFGDVDLAGINIFQTEFASYLGIDAFMVPPSYGKDIANGSVEVFEVQHKYLRVQGLSPRIQEVINTIKQEKKCLLQEYWLKQTPNDE